MTYNETMERHIKNPKYTQEAFSNDPFKHSLLDGFAVAMAKNERDQTLHEAGFTMTTFTLSNDQKETDEGCYEREDEKGSILSFYKQGYVILSASTTKYWAAYENLINFGLIDRVTEAHARLTNWAEKQMEIDAKRVKQGLAPLSQKEKDQSKADVLHDMYFMHMMKDNRALMRDKMEKFAAAAKAHDEEKKPRSDA